MNKVKVLPLKKVKVLPLFVKFAYNVCKIFENFNNIYVVKKINVIINILKKSDTHVCNMTCLGGS